MFYSRQYSSLSPRGKDSRSLKTWARMCLNGVWWEEFVKLEKRVRGGGALATSTNCPPCPPDWRDLTAELRAEEVRETQSVPGLFCTFPRKGGGKTTLESRMVPLLPRENVRLSSERADLGQGWQGVQGGNLKYHFLGAGWMDVSWVCQGY